MAEIITHGTAAKKLGAGHSALDRKVGIERLADLNHLLPRDVIDWW
jgi:hypothetical protein